MQNLSEKYKDLKLTIGRKDLPTFHLPRNQRANSDMYKDYETQPVPETQRVEIKRPQSTMDWWKQRTNYNEKPSIVSQREVETKKYYWIKSDDFYMNEKTNDLPAPDPFKRAHKPVLKKRDEDMHWEKPTSIARSRDNSGTRNEQLTSSLRCSTAKQPARYSSTYFDSEPMDEDRLFERIVRQSKRHE